jgi:hypothetical protein
VGLSTHRLHKIQSEYSLAFPNVGEYDPLGQGESAELPRGICAGIWDARQFVVPRYGRSVYARRMFVS